MKSKTLRDKLNNKQLLFQKIKAEGIDQIYYSDEYINAFFANPLLNPTKLVSQPLSINQSNNLTAMRTKFALGEEYNKPLLLLAERIFRLGSFFSLIGEKYQSIKVKQSQLRKFQLVEGQPNQVKITKYVNGKNVSVSISDKGSMQGILSIIALEEKALSKGIRPIGELYSKTTTAFCNSLFNYLQAIPLLDSGGNLLTDKHKMKLAGCILAAADWIILENNQQKTGYKQPRTKVKLNFTEAFLNKIYKTVHSRITRSTNSGKLLK